MKNLLSTIVTLCKNTLLRRSNLLTDESGQALVVAAVSLTVLMLAAGLSIDVGYLRYQKRRMQTAADSAAIAGATQLGGDWVDASTTDASINGFSSPNGSTVSPTAVSCPDGTANCVQVQVTQSEPIFFTRIVNANLAPVVTATATAEQVPGLGCMYALSNDPQAVIIGESYHTIVAGPNCGFVDNGGLILDAPSHTLYAQSVGVGSYLGGGTVTPAPVTLGVLSADPFATLAPPPSDSGSCGSGSPSGYIAGTFDYPCGLYLNPYVGTVINLQPGLYHIGAPSGGGGLTIIPNSGSVVGTGVTFYLEGNASVSINAGVDESMGFGASVQLQASPDGSAGTIPGVVLFQDRTDAQPDTIALAGFPSSDTGDPDSYMWGAIYAPAATVTLIGMGYDGPVETEKCSSVPRLTTVIANMLVFHENLNFSTDDCQWPPVPVSTSVPSPNRNAVLVK